MDNTSGKRPLGRVARVVLILSLTLNVIVIGGVVGAIASGKAKGPHFDLNLGPYARSLEPEHRRAIGATLRNRGDLRPPSRSQRRQEREALIAALLAEPFDPTIVEDQLTDQRDRTIRLISAAQAALIEQIMIMSVEDRQDFAERLDGEFEDHHSRHGSGRDR